MTTAKHLRNLLNLNISNLLWNDNGLVVEARFSQGYHPVLTACCQSGFRKSFFEGDRSSFDKAQDERPYETLLADYR
jgi:hypothetical protein